MSLRLHGAGHETMSHGVAHTVVTRQALSDFHNATCELCRQKAPGDRYRAATARRPAVASHATHKSHLEQDLRRLSPKIANATDRSVATITSALLPAYQHMLFDISITYRSLAFCIACQAPASSAVLRLEVGPRKTQNSLDETTWKYAKSIEKNRIKASGWSLPGAEFCSGLIGAPRGARTSKIPECRDRPLRVSERRSHPWAALHEWLPNGGAAGLQPPTPSPAGPEVQ